ncbi:MAG: arginase [Microbacteriaceae bacterium]|jgi:arginase|nr:arginase [Microbacteriaceae bacterium]
MRLADGAEAIRGDLPAASTRAVDVPMEAGDDLGTGLPRLGSLTLVRERTFGALESLHPTSPASPAAAAADWTLSIGGDCGAQLAPIEHAMGRTGGDVAVVWLDAHPDLNTPESSPSKAFSGMVLRTLLGEGPAELVPATPLRPEHLVLAGIRSTDDAEDEFVRGSAVRTLGVDSLGTPDALLAAIAATGAASVYLHIDLDVLDPAEIAGLSDPVPFGVSTADLVQLVRAVKARFALAGAGISGFSPASPEAATDDLPTILRIIGSLTT